MSSVRSTGAARVEYELRESSMAEMQFACPHCNVQFALAQPPSGEAIACPGCGTLLEIPVEGTPSSATADQQESADEPFVPFDFRDEIGAPRLNRKWGTSTRAAVKVRRLTRSERAQRQRRRSLFLMIVGTLVLMGAVLLLSKV